MTDNTLQFRNTMLQRDALINTIAGNDPLPQRFPSDWAKGVLSQLALIREEALETMSADHCGDLEEFRDGLCDLVVTANGLAHRMGFQAVVLDPVVEQHLQRYGMGYIDYLIHTDIPRIIGEIRQFTAYTPNRTVLPILGSLQQLYAWTIAVVEDLANHDGFDLMEDHATVFLSNLSKFDRDFETSQRTLAKYLEMGYPAIGRVVDLGEEHGDYSGRYWVTVLAEDHVDANGMTLPKGKFLKSVNFIKPRFQ